MIEAGLIVGIVLAATKGVPRRGLWVAYGFGGAAGACLVAAFAGQIATLFEGSGQELFNASIWSWRGDLRSPMSNNGPFSVTRPTER